MIVYIVYMWSVMLWQGRENHLRSHMGCLGEAEARAQPRREEESLLHIRICKFDFYTLLKAVLYLQL